jgi:hypothetical protein
MRTRTTAGRLAVVLTAVITLAACQDGATAPIDPGRERVMADLSGNCGRQQPSRILSATTPPTLPTVTVTATFPGFATGLPWNIVQQMNFPLNAGAHQAPCQNTPGTTYIAETLYVSPDTVAKPDGVSEEFWASLSRRERTVLLASAELYLRLNPNVNKTPGIVISEVFEDAILRSKSLAQRRATDFLGASQATELMAGGVYGCMLYKEFVASGTWFLSNNATLQLVADLVGAFAEAEFRLLPLRATRFARNGVFGVGLAFNDVRQSDCGTLVFNAMNAGTIDVSDPYDNGGLTPSPTPPPGGGYYPPLPPENGLPPGWMDQ